LYFSVLEVPGFDTIEEQENVPHFHSLRCQLVNSPCQEQSRIQFWDLMLAQGFAAPSRAPRKAVGNSAVAKVCHHFSS